MLFDYPRRYRTDKNRLKPKNSNTVLSLNQYDCKMMISCATRSCRFALHLLFHWQEHRRLFGQLAMLTAVCLIAMDSSYQLSNKGSSQNRIKNLYLIRREKHIWGCQPPQQQIGQTTRQKPWKRLKDLVIEVLLHLNWVVNLVDQQLRYRLMCIVSLRKVADLTNIRLHKILWGDHSLDFFGLLTLVGVFVWGVLMGGALLGGLFAGWFLTVLLPLPLIKNR